MNSNLGKQNLTLTLDLSIEQIYSLTNEAKVQGVTFEEHCKNIIVGRPGQVNPKDGVKAHFDTRIVTALWGERINTIEDLLHYDLSRLHRVPRLGPKAHATIETFLLEKGLIINPIQKK